MQQVCQYNFMDNVVAAQGQQCGLSSALDANPDSDFKLSKVNYEQAESHDIVACEPHSLCSIGCCRLH